ncbi:MAG TPA: methyltransferase domain-containing protein [Polyangiaceae bacterium]
MTEERARPSSPDSDEIEVTADEPLDPKAARRARRAKAKLALRIPDDEIARPEPKEKEKSNGNVDVTAAPIQPSRIISVGPPPPSPTEKVLADKKLDEQKTERRIPSAPPTVPLDQLPDDAGDRKTQLDMEEPSDEEEKDDDGIPVDEDEPQYRPRVPTMPSNPPPAPGEAAPKRQPSDDALEIDDVEAAAVLSSRPPPRGLNTMAPAVPPAPRVPTISSKPPVPPAPISPPIPADALSSTPHLLDDRPKPRARATALIDDEEARGIEEIEPDRASAPPTVDSGDEIDTADLEISSPPVVALAKDGAAARPISTPPKAPKGPPPTSGKMPIVAPTPGAAPSPLAPPPLTEGLVPRRRARPWWEELFNDDFIRTMPKFTDAQIATEVDFIEDSLGVARGGSLLDLGCGTGKEAVELSRRGYSVVGFDLSISMLARAGEEAQDASQKINFVQGDMREMTFEDAFDGVYCWGSTFGYFEEEKNAQVIQRVHKSLRQGGQFLLDVVSRDFVIAQSPSLAWFEGEGCVCMDEMSVDWITSRMRVKRTMMLDDGRSKEIEYSVRIYALHELGKLLHDSGFRVAEVSGRIQTPGVFFGPNSPRTLILAEKR